MFKKNKLVVIVSISIVIVFVILYFLIQAFSEPQANLGYVDTYSEEYQLSDSIDPNYDEGLSYGEKSSYEAEESIDIDTKLIKTGDLSMTVDDLEETSQSIVDIVKGNDGYVSNLYEYGVNNSKTVSATVRIPVDSFDTVLSQIEDLAIEVQSSNQSTDDITEVYVDLEARLTSKKAVEEQYIALLDKAVDVEDMLLIQEQLGYVRENIESLEAQLKYYDSQSDYSTISISLSLSSEGVQTVDDSWDPLGTIKDAANAFVGVLRASGNVIIWVVVFSPIVIIPWFIVKLRKKKNK